MIGSNFICNICGRGAQFNPVGDWREAPSCSSCGSSVRVRQMVHCVALGVLGKSVPLPSVEQRDITGVGLSDPEVLADALTKAFSYKNSFYYQQPRLDICSPSPQWIGTADFLTSSDIFDLVSNPVSKAFSGAYQVLKPNGLLVLTVPFDDRPVTTEYFPGVVESKAITFNGEWLLIGKTTSGQFQIYRDVTVRTDPHASVAMRFFGLSDLLRDLLHAGFSEIHVHAEAVPDYGIFPPHGQGLPITAWKR